MLIGPDTRGHTFLFQLQVIAKHREPSVHKAVFLPAQYISYLSPNERQSAACEKVRKCAERSSSGEFKPLVISEV